MLNICRHKNTPRPRLKSKQKQIPILISMNFAARFLKLWTTTKKDGTSEEHGTAKRLIQLTKMAPAMKTL